MQNEQLSQKSERLAELEAARSAGEQGMAGAAEELQVVKAQLQAATESSTAWQQYGEGKDAELATALAKIGDAEMRASELELARDALSGNVTSFAEEVARMLGFATSEVSRVQAEASARVSEAVG